MPQNLPGITEVWDEVEIALDRVRKNLTVLPKEAGDGDPYRVEEYVRLMEHDLAMPSSPSPRSPGPPWWGTPKSPCNRSPKPHTDAYGD